MNAIRRYFIERRFPYDTEARALLRELRDDLGIAGLRRVRVLSAYDLEDAPERIATAVRDLVLSEPPLETVTEGSFPLGPEETAFAVAYLAGQYDQRADSAAQCVALLTEGERIAVGTARVIVLDGTIGTDDLARIQRYCVNPVDSRLVPLTPPMRLVEAAPDPGPVPVLTGFSRASATDLDRLRTDFGLAMDADDLALCQAYFRDIEGRDPRETEIRLLDTYWSDHCRHTTFHTRLTPIRVEDGPLAAPVADALDRCRELLARHGRGTVAGDPTLMGIALLAMRELRSRGRLDDLEESDEINACSVAVTVPVRRDGREVQEEWLVMFKNETHNHPTEIEPYGGAATCLGGAIRDPLSGRSYVYQAMRVTGAGDPRQPIEETLPGKLPQRKITTEAAAGFSAYGNQIGLCTGQVEEYYDPGYVAKRMEVGAVIGAAPRRHVVRAEPRPGDLVVWIGGRTGRDGIGGATGSSKAHSEKSLATCYAEVQKGNPPIERQLQRFFRAARIGPMIRKCNDFGAGGVAVAVGELADGVEIDLDALPRKYEGLGGTELALSESQERMAVVIAPGDLAEFLRQAAAENLEAAVVATVSAIPRLRMTWRGERIVDLARDFLESHGAEKRAEVRIASPDPEASPFRPPLAGGEEHRNLADRWRASLADLAVCSRRGLVERFDGSIGRASVFFPYGGSHQGTPQPVMAARLPVTDGETDFATLMSHGFLPPLSRWSPFHGAVYAVVLAITRLVAAGGDPLRARLTLQEYFGRPGADPLRWGDPLAALLGAFTAQLALEVPAIGGKDSMSGTFQELSVPPTLVAFAVGTGDARRFVSAEFKRAGEPVIWLPLPRDGQEMPRWAVLRQTLSTLHRLTGAGQLTAALAVDLAGIGPSLARMAFGNRIGLRFVTGLDAESLFTPAPGGLLVSLPEGADPAVLLADLPWQLLGVTQVEPLFRLCGEDVPLDSLRSAWEAPLARVFPTRPEGEVETAILPAPLPPRGHSRLRGQVRVASPRVLVAVFPGTNCETDTSQAFVEAGARPEVLVFRNRTAEDIGRSLVELAEKIGQAQILMIPGGFSAGDEPGGSGKYIAAVFRNSRITEAVREFLARGGLILGICNGFQALIKLGLVPYGDITEVGPLSPTLTGNSIGRHVSRIVRVKAVSNLSPWLARFPAGETRLVAVSHGEGRLVASPEETGRWLAAGQVATRYVDDQGFPSMDPLVNPNGSTQAIEGLTSPDGRIFGRMGHPERWTPGLFLNVPGDFDHQLFRAGVDFFA